MATVTRFPSSDTAVSGTWTTPTNVQADDGAYASVVHAVKNTSVERQQGNYGFDSVIPAAATINSVTIEVQHKVDVTNGVAILENLGYVSGVAGAVNSDSSEPTTDTIFTSTNYARPGGGGWTRADLLNGTFTTGIRATAGNSSQSVTYSWDYIKVTVDYTNIVTADTTEAGSAADGVNGVRALPVSGSDAASPSESSSAAGALAGSRVEATALNESSTAQAVFVSVSTNPATALDVLTALSNVLASRSEPASLSDLNDASIVYGVLVELYWARFETPSPPRHDVSISEAGSAIDSADRVATTNALATEVSLFSDSYDVTASFTALRAESASATDAVNSIASFGVSVAEALAAADNGSAVFIVIVSRSEPTTITESNSAVIAKQADHYESASAVDDQSLNSVAVADINESATLAHSQSVIVAYSLVATESLSGSDTQSVVVLSASSVTETGTANVTATVIGDFVANIDEISDAQEIVHGFSLQNYRPISDTAQGTWAPSSGVDLYAMIDEAAPSSVDYISTSAGLDVCIMKLSTDLSTPPDTANHVMRYRIEGQGPLTVRLKEGSTVIAQRSHLATGSVQNIASPLTEAEAGAIIDYTNLSIEFETV